ncbi:MAG: hypothetical protein JWP60_13, partial [Ramlibacter sp.]|nr:hypothetical protein [Ramlibacter sp.]
MTMAVTSMGMTATEAGEGRRTGHSSRWMLRALARVV